MENLLNKQAEIQELLGNDLTSQKFKNDMCLALIVETTEALNETPWKPWKKQQSLDIEKYKEELVDMQIFLLNLVLTSGMSRHEFEMRIMAKQEKNIERIQNGY